MRAGFAEMPRRKRRDSSSSVAATRNGAAELGSAGTVDVLEREALDRPDRDLAAPPLDAHARVAQQALGVVARRDRLDHDRRARRRRTGPASSTHDLTWAEATGSV